MLLVFLSILTGAVSAEVSSAKPRVAATFPILAGIVQRVGGDDFEVISVLRGNADPHSFEPRPSDGMRLKDALLLFGIGGGFDNWAFKLFQPLHQETSCAPLSFLDTFSSQQLVEKFSFDGRTDPHIWLDPLLVRDSLVPAIRDTFSKCFPERKLFFDTNATAFQAELTGLDRELSSLFQPLQFRKFLSIHSSWLYFCKRYHLDLIGELESSPAQRGSMRRVITLIKRAKDESVKVIVAQTNPEEQQVAEKIAGEINGKVLVLDTLGVISAQFPPDYSKELRNIAQRLSESLSR